MLKRAVLNQIKSEILPLITHFQHGFLGGKSVETQLIQVYNHINAIFYSSGQTYIIYSDFSKAFDSFAHFPLPHRLRSCGFNGSLHQWLCSYVNNRKQRADCLILQNDLQALDNWDNTWKLQFNYNKNKVLHIARVIKQNFDYRMNDITLVQVSAFNDLGMTLYPTTLNGNLIFTKMLIKRIPHLH